MNKPLQNQLEFLAIADKMKTIERQSLLIDSSRRENNAEHSWHFALMAITLFEHCALENVDINRVIQMAIVHDLVEIYADDSPAMDASVQANKTKREQAAADKLFALLPAKQANEYRSLWEEFDAIQTPDAIYASAIDRLQSFINIYKSGGKAWTKYSAPALRVRTRMLPVKSALPALWPYVEAAIADGIKQGWIKP